MASVTDKRKAYNVAVIAYWPSESSFRSWRQDSGSDAWWNSADRESDGHGWFQECFIPSVDRLETVFSNNEVPEGAANLREKISGEMSEHAYWGSMRDRLVQFWWSFVSGEPTEAEVLLYAFPVALGKIDIDLLGRLAAAQNDLLEGEKLVSNALNGHVRKDGGVKRICVPGKKNLCVIRSGQDWSATLPAERKLYLETMHPVLIKGMVFLRDEGKSVGCHANNLWGVIDPSSFGAKLDKTYGLGFFDDLSSLEHWSKSHATHLNIFGGFLTYAKKLDNVLSLRLFHEIYVLEEGQQFFEYVGCHDETGMLNAASVVDR